MPFRALTVSAHPDDVEFGCAGTLARWADEGAEITLCIVTDGSTGTQDRWLMGEGLSEVRKRETEEAAKIIGASEVVWLDYRDGYVEYSLDLRRDIARVFRRVCPHRYVVMDPTPVIDSFVNHPDHRAVALASLDVTLTAGTTPGHFPELLEEGLDPWRGLRELWIMGPGTRQTAVDIAKTLDRKIEALLCHASQVGEDADRIREWMTQRTAEIGKPAGYAHAEAFNIIKQGPGFHAEEVEEDVPLTEPPPRPGFVSGPQAVLVNHAQVYGGAKGRIVDLVEGADAGTAVPACSGWTVKDLIAHLAGGLGDFVARRFDDAGSPEWGERQVLERRDRSLEDSLAEWDENLDEAGPTFESPLGGVLVTEIVLHEHDIRGALGRPGERRSAAIEAALASPLGEIDRRIRDKGLPPLRVVSDEGERTLGEGDPAVTLRASSFELLRAISGRRGVERVLALGWSGDPTPWLEVLALFGTPRSDVEE